MGGFPQAGLPGVFKQGEESQDCGVKGASWTVLLAVPGSLFQHSWVTLVSFRRGKGVSGPVGKESGSSGHLLLTGLLMDLSCQFWFHLMLSEPLPLIQGEEGAYLGWLLLLGWRSKHGGSG